MNPRISIIIPARNEAGSIGDVLNGIPRHIVHEVLVVDGHSSDHTVEMVKLCGHKFIQQEGHGYGDAVSTGIKHTTGDIIILLDADGSYDLKDIPILLDCIKNGFDAAFGSRYLPNSGSHDDTWIRFVGNKFFTFLLRAIHHVKISDSLFLYIAARREVFNKIHMQSKGFEYCIEFPIKVHKAGFKYTEIPSVEKKRTAGKSKVNVFLDGLRILKILFFPR